MEEAPWAAMRTLEEKISLLRRMSARSGDKRAAEYSKRPASSTVKSKPFARF
jgi:hypothetical protein